MKVFIMILGILFQPVVVVSYNFTCGELMTYSCWDLSDSWYLKSLLNDCLEYKKRDSPMRALGKSDPVHVQIDFLTLSLEHFDAQSEVSLKCQYFS